MKLSVLSWLKSHLFQFLQRLNVFAQHNDKSNSKTNKKNTHKTKEKKKENVVVIYFYKKCFERQKCAKRGKQPMKTVPTTTISYCFIHILLLFIHFFSVSVHHWSTFRRVESMKPNWDFFVEFFFFVEYFDFHLSMLPNVPTQFWSYVDSSRCNRLFLPCSSHLCPPPPNIWYQRTKSLCKRGNCGTKTHLLLVCLVSSLHF